MKTSLEYEVKRGFSASALKCHIFITPYIKNHTKNNKEMDRNNPGSWATYGTMAGVAVGAAAGLFLWLNQRENNNRQNQNGLYANRDQRHRRIEEERIRRNEEDSQERMRRILEEERERNIREARAREERQRLREEHQRRLEEEQQRELQEEAERKRIEEEKKKKEAEFEKQRRKMFSKFDEVFDEEFDRHL